MTTTIQTEPFPDMTNFEYHIAVPPSGFKLSAWPKLQECERRIAYYEWIEKRNDRQNSKHPRILLNDSISAFLLNFESTIQFLMHDYNTLFKNKQLGDWFKNQPQNDIYVKGLRTLRHFEAHVETNPPIRHIHLNLPEDQVTLTFKFWKLNMNDISNLKSPQLKTQQEIDDWNELTENYDIKEIIIEALIKLKDIINALESILISNCNENQ